MNLKTYIATPDNAEKIAFWLRMCGGIAIWQSVFFCHVGESVTTPFQSAEGSPSPRPAWWVDFEPECVITDPADVLVCKDVEVKRFHVAIRGRDGWPPIKCTDGGYRRIRAAKARAGVGSHYRIDLSTQDAVIMKREWQLPLLDFIDARKTLSFHLMRTAFQEK